MRDTFLPFSPPWIGREEIDAVVDTLRSDWITTGPKTGRFEKLFADYVQAPASLGLNSCTAGLHVALKTLGIGPGDEVITTPLTFAASVNVIEHVGARPVLVDVEPDTLNLSPDGVEKAVTPRTKVILPVHFAGHPVELDAIGAIAAENQLAVLEDAAHGLPARFGGKLIGSHGNPTAYSFYATKNMTTGEGGMLTGEPTFLEEARIVSLHGMSREAWRRYEQGGAWKYDVVAPGFKYNMTDIQASIGICQLERLDGFQARRREIVHEYFRGLGDLDEVELPVEKPHVEHAWHLFVIRLRTQLLCIDRDAFIEELAARKIGTSVHFIPIHLHSYYREKYGYRPVDFPTALAAYERIVSLPLYPRMSDQDVADVIEAVRGVVTGNRVARSAA